MTLKVYWLFGKLLNITLFVISSCFRSGVGLDFREKRHFNKTAFITYFIFL